MYLSFENMPVWRLAFELSDEVFELSSKLPRSEDYGLTSQIRRSSNSVSTNIAEGFGRNGNKDKIKYYVISRGFAFENQHHLKYGLKVKSFNKDITESLIEKYTNLIHDLNKLIKSLR